MKAETLMKLVIPPDATLVDVINILNTIGITYGEDAYNAVMQLHPEWDTWFVTEVREPYGFQLYDYSNGGGETQ